jgi:3-dehydroquinate dehydratase / shikimate dehydrogenase
MSQAPIITTERLTLDPWKKDDLAPFRRMNADPKVMEFFPNTLTGEQSDAMASKCQAHIEKHGWGLFAVHLKETSAFIGFIGLWPVSFQAHFTPATEIGWRLSSEYWGKGYATEGAKAALEYGFNQLGLKEIVSFTTEKNLRSRKVMQRLGMSYVREDDFDHPKLEDDSPLKPHVLYRKKG